MWRSLIPPITLFGTVAVMLTLTTVVTLSRGEHIAQCIIEATPYVNANTNGAAQQNERRTSAVMRSIGRWFAICVK